MWYRTSSNNLITIYHGTDTEPGLGQRSGYYPGTYTLISKKDVTHHGANVYTAKIDLNKVYSITEETSAEQLKKEAATAGFGYHSGNGRAEVEYLKSKGFIGLRRGIEILIFDGVSMNWTHIVEEQPEGDNNEDRN